jgi:hypothetical protein
MKCCFENDRPSPDGSENPFEKNGYFFLYGQSDQRIPIAIGTASA